MKHTIILFSIYCLILSPAKSQAKPGHQESSKSLTSDKVIHHLPDNVLPVIGAWFWDADDFKPFLDQVYANSCFNLLSTAIRRKDITDVNVHNQVKLAVAYAKELGIKIALEMDVRLVRDKFGAMYPDELQESLWLKEVKLSTSDPVQAVIRSIDLSDHMTGRSKYISLRGSLLRVYSYEKSAEGIDPNTLKDITKECQVTSSTKDSILVSIPAYGKNSQLQACVMVSFTYLTPDVFAPHLIEFQRELVWSYSDIPLAGGMKDEWGFPPSTPANRMALGNHFWYSKNYALAYAKETGGRELLADCLLMYVGIKGQQDNRQLAINHYMEMNWKRNGALEDDYYHTLKEVFGPGAIVVTHPTWYPYPDRLENKKNGLDWWVATRDWAQTDEVTPFAVRTALAKKWNSPVWYNQYYDFNKEGKISYQRELWSSALAGGRLNYHPSGSSLFIGNLMQGESRVRLLNFITRSPLNCPVALIFGHPSTMNWAGPYFEDCGMQVADSLWSLGIPTDLIPSSEIENNNLSVDENGWIHYGKQRYAAVILYNPEFEKLSTSVFFNKASKGQTKLFRVGNWSMDFTGKTFDGNAALPKTMIVADNKSIMSEVLKILKKQKIEIQTPASRILKGFGHVSNAPPTKGFCRLIDGTLIQVAGTNDIAGDIIESKMKIGKYEVAFNAVGVAAVRLDDKGRVQALAAGGLKSFKTKDLVIQLNERVDLAFWTNETGELKGVIQGLKGEIPPQLLAITKDWLLLTVPVSLPE